MIFRYNRYADVLLLSAEANVRATGTVSADDMEKLNVVHRRAYGYDPLVASAVDFKVADLYQGYLLLIWSLKNVAMKNQCEGKRWPRFETAWCSQIKTDN